MFRDLRDRDLLEKVYRKLNDESHIVLMDVSNNRLDNEWIVNSGVLIEFGLAIFWRGIEYVYLFCDENTDRDKLPPLIPRTEVEQYNSSNPTSLKTKIKEALRKFEREAPEREKRFEKMGLAALSLYNSTRS